MENIERPLASKRLISSNGYLRRNNKEIKVKKNMIITYAINRISYLLLAARKRP